MNNMFKDAYFGQRWKTRNGKIAIFQHKTEDDAYSFVSEDCIFHVRSDGRMYFEFDDDVISFKEIHPELDIIAPLDDISQEEIKAIAIERNNWCHQFDKGLTWYEVGFIEGFNECQKLCKKIM